MTDVGLPQMSRGVTYNMPLDGGGVVVGDKVQITLEVEAVLQQPTA